jgi:hypothetical protein
MHLNFQKVCNFLLQFRKQKEKAQNQNIKNEEHKKAVQRQDKER